MVYKSRTAEDQAGTDSAGWTLLHRCISRKITPSNEKSELVSGQHAPKGQRELIKVRPSQNCETHTPVHRRA